MRTRAAIDTVRRAALEALPRTAVGGPGAADELAPMGTTHQPGARMRTATLHLLGPGRVGSSFLRQLQDLPVRVVAVTDSGGTLHDAGGIDVEALLRHKASGSSVATMRGGRPIDAVEAIGQVRADFVVDATPTDVAGTEAAVRRGDAALGTGAFLALCAKNALAAAGDRWLRAPHLGRVGIHAVLGGAGRQLVRDLDMLRAGCTGLALVGNVTTTVVIQAVESGASVAQGIEQARQRGLLEPDPTLDLDGSDAATKLCAVWNVLFAVPASLRAVPATVPRQDLRTLDAAVVQQRAARGATTRLVGRATRDGQLRVGYEELPAGSALAAPADRVVYGFELADRLHIATGDALGHDRTAAALLTDVSDALGPSLRT